MKRIHFALRCGMTDRELVEEARYDGTPLACHLTLKTGPSRISLASPNGSRIEKGHTWSANISFWGSNICRAGWIAEEAGDLPSTAREYVSAFAGPYFEAMAEWFHHLRIGQPGGVLYRLIQERLPFEKFDIFLNPGHLIHLDEWVSSPIYEGSDIRIRSGMVIQTDVIPSSPVYFSTRMEDGVAIVDEALREELRRRFPACYERCQARRRFVQDVPGHRAAGGSSPSLQHGLHRPTLLASSGAYFCIAGLDRRNDAPAQDIEVPRLLVLISCSGFGRYSECDSDDSLRALAPLDSRPSP